MIFDKEKIVRVVPTIIICIIVIISNILLPLNVNASTVIESATLENENKSENKTGYVRKDVAISTRSSFTQRKSLEETIQETTNENKELEENDLVETTYITVNEVYLNKNMALNSTTGLSKADFVNLLTNLKYDRKGFYERNAGIIWEYCRQYNVNELFVCGIFAIESGWGTASNHIKTNNYGSIMTGSGKLRYFATEEEGIKENIRLLSENYLNSNGKYYSGATLSGVVKKYCPVNSSHWVNSVYSSMQKILNS